MIEVCLLKYYFESLETYINDAIINKQSSINLIYLVYAIVSQFYEKSQ